MAQAVEQFRSRAGEWLSANAPPPEPDATEEERVRTAKRFQKALHEAGFAGITWPAEFGGMGLSAAEQQAFDEQAAAFELPTSLFMIGLGMCGPTLVDLGTTEQKTRYVPPLLRGDEIWCQLFSEPGAGSDVAGLQTSAVRDGDEWIVNGQKVWTSNAQHADFGALLARTDPDVPKHRGITMLIVDMRAPGVQVRPLRDMTGRAPFNEVRFEDVRVPADAVLGEVDAGWAAAVTMLGHERVSIGGSTRPRYDPLAHHHLAEVARSTGRDADPAVRRELAALHAAERRLALFNARLNQLADAGHPPGADGSVAKLAGAELLWRAVHVAGLISRSGLTAWEPDDPDAEALAVAVNAAPASSIAGGTNQVQRTIIGERVLGLPREPRVDRDVPFRQLWIGTQSE